MAQTPAAAGTNEKTGLNVVFFDGVCALCNGSVRLFIRRDRNTVLSFAPLQGETFATLNARLEAGLDSMVYVRGHGTDQRQVYVRSEAVLQILRDLGGFWRVVSWARIVPRFLRDPIYDLIARKRYRWFGRYDECRLPTPRQKEQLLP